jgi:hypothetical protein
MTLSAYRSVRLVGGIISADALTRAADLGMPAQAPDDYQLTPGVTVTAAIARAWNDLLGAWQERRRRLAALPGDAANRITRERWLQPLLGQLGYGRVPSVPAGIDLPPGLGDTKPRHYPITHQLSWPVNAPDPTAAVAIHLVAGTVDLDRRTTGMAARAPHGMVQEFLNHSDRHLYALLSNGLTLRLLRDASTLTKQSYLEFDLQLMFDEQLFSDFRLMWLLLHATRLTPDEQRDGEASAAIDAQESDEADTDEDDEPARDVATGPAADDCWLEKWRSQALHEGSRARDALQAGVAAAITSLGTGFVSHPANDALRQALHDEPDLDQDLRKWLLRCVYRFIVLFVAEDRELLHPEDPQSDAAAARALYRDYFSTSRLRRLAATRTGSRHSDLWPAHIVVTDALAGSGSDLLSLPALADSLYGREHIGLLGAAQISNRHLLAAVRHLSQVKDRITGKPGPVDYRNLDSEELGGVYEGLLSYVPRYDPAARTFTLTMAGGSERKKTGSYYTPTELIALVLDESLEPLLAQAVRTADPEGALLALTVCDPACGSGHFLVAAARRIAAAVAVQRTKDPEPSPAALREAMRDVVAKCIYGVDVNDLAIEVAKVALWLEALTPGKPFAFLDHHLKVGNALLGTTPKLLRDGIPDDAYAVLDGDEKEPTAKLKSRNKSERTAAQKAEHGQTALVELWELYIPTTDIGDAAAKFDIPGRDTVDEIRRQADAWRKLDADPDLQASRLLNDAWCAAFVQAKRTDGTPGITHRTLQYLREGGSADPAIEKVIRRHAREHRFFHWHLEFPAVFAVPLGADSTPANAETLWTGGFSCILGNPPWERVKLQEKEWGEAVGHTPIATAKNKAVRAALIDGLRESDPPLHEAFLRARRRSQEAAHFLLKSGRYPHTGRGDVNTYSVFAEDFRTLLKPDGRAGIVTPTGLATDKTTSGFFKNLQQTRSLAAFHDFVTNPKIWQEIGHGRFRFAVTSMTGPASPSQRVRMSFFSKSPSEVTEQRVFELAPPEIELLNPNTGTLPIFVTRTDAEITLDAYRRHSVLIRDAGPAKNAWGLTFLRAFDMATDSHRFLDTQDLENAVFDGWSYSTELETYLPLYEGKLFWFYDHRLSSYALRAPTSQDTELPRLSNELHDNPAVEAGARYWVPRQAVTDRLQDKWPAEWLLGWRDITNATNERTLVPTILPKAATADNVLLALPLVPARAYLLQATWSSLACDFIARQKMSGSHLKYFVMKQLAIPEPGYFDRPCPWAPSDSLAEWLRPRVLELTYTSDRLSPYAEELGDFGRPFRWDPARRLVLRVELDAAFMHVYGWSRHQVEHVLNSFEKMQRYERRDLGEYRTARLVLDAYDRMAVAATIGSGWSSAMCPAPGDGARHP